MKLYRRYRMDYQGRWLNPFCILCGLAFFLRVAYYFMFMNPTQCGMGEILFSMILPLLTTAAAMVVLKYFKLNAPGIVGIIGAFMCLSLLVGTFFAGGALRIILGILLYGTAAVLLIGTVGGYVPTRQFVLLLLSLCFLIRILFFRPGFTLLGWVLELSDLTMLLSLILLPVTMVPVKSKNGQTNAISNC